MLVSKPAISLKKRPGGGGGYRRTTQNRSPDMVTKRLALE